MRDTNTEGRTLRIRHSSGLDGEHPQHNTDHASQIQDTGIEFISSTCCPRFLQFEAETEKRMSYIWAGLGTRCGVRRLVITHPPSCYNESCLLGRSETATHIQSVCACDGGFTNSTVSRHVKPPLALYTDEEKGTEEGQRIKAVQSRAQIPANTQKLWIYISEF